MAVLADSVETTIFYSCTTAADRLYSDRLCSNEATLKQRY